MDKKKRTFVQFFEDKQYLPTHSAVEAKGRDFEDLKLPEGCVALQFFDVYEVEAIDQDKTFLLKSEKVNKGPVTFVPGCTVYSVKEIQEQFPKEKYLLVDVTGNNCSGAVLSPRGAVAHSASRAGRALAIHSPKPGTGRFATGPFSFLTKTLL